MKGRTLLVTGLAALVLAACSPKAPTPTPTPNLGAPYSCVEPGKSPIAHLSQGVSFDVTSLASEFYPVKTNICDKVVSFKDYAIVGARSPAVGGDLFFSIAYVFKKLPSSPSELGFIGSVPNKGLHRHVIVGNYKDLGDILIVASDVWYEGGPKSVDTEFNNGMLNELARSITYYDHRYKNWEDVGLFYIKNPDLNFGSKVEVYALNNPESIRPYDPNVKPRPVVLKKLAARPVLFGLDVLIESMRVTQQDGRLMLEIRTSQRGTDGQRYPSLSDRVPIDTLVKEGINPMLPLLKP